MLIYDGIAFKLLDKYDGLENNFVSKVYIDKNENIWISYYEGGITKLTPEIKRFSTRFYKSEAVVSIFEEDSILKVITIDAKIGSYNQKESKFNFQENKRIEVKLISQVALGNGKKVYQTVDGLYVDLNNKLQLIPETEFNYIKILRKNKTTNTFAYESDGVVTAYGVEDKIERLFSLDLKKIGITSKVTDLDFGEKK